MNEKRFLLLVLTVAVTLIAGIVASYIFITKTASAQEKKQEKPALYSRLTIAPIKSDKMDELMKIYKESIVPAAKAQKGYKGAYLLTNRETNKAISVTVWDDEANAIANEQSGYYQEQVAKAKDCFAGAPVREGYYISVSDMPVQRQQ